MTVYNFHIIFKFCLYVRHQKCYRTSILYLFICSSLKCYWTSMLYLFVCLSPKCYWVIHPNRTKNKNEMLEWTPVANNLYVKFWENLEWKIKINSNSYIIFECYLCVRHKIKNVTSGHTIGQMKIDLHENLSVL